jgi:hypothetical protein
MGRPEFHIHIDEIDPIEWRPDAVNIDKINREEKWDKFEKSPEKRKTIKKKIIQKEEVKKMKNLFAIDCSGSVHGKDLYHFELNQIIEEYYKEGDLFYLWNHEIWDKKVSREGMKMFIDEKEGFGGTNSTNIAKIAIDAGNSYREHLIIVTDGEVDLEDIKESTKLLNNNKITFKYVTTFIIGDGSNLSVGAPYCRDCPNITYEIRESNQRKK